MTGLRLYTQGESFQTMDILKKTQIFGFGFGFFVLIAYQPFCVIKCQSHPRRRTAVVLSKP